MSDDKQDRTEAAARHLAKWIGYSYDGLREDRIADRGFKQWCYNGVGDLNYQGGKQDLKDLAEQIFLIMGSD